MAYLVRRPRGRFEIRESVHTSRGPRARTLANFAVLTEAVLEAARGRAQRPFQAEGLIRRAGELGVPCETGGPGSTGDYRRFVAASRRLGASFQRRPAAAEDPGQALIELSELVEAMGEPRRRPPRLSYPVLARLAGS